MGQGSLKRRQKRLNGYEQKKAKLERERRIKRAMKLKKKGIDIQRPATGDERRRIYKEKITVAHKAAKRGTMPHKKEKAELFTQIATAPPPFITEDVKMRYADYARKRGIQEHRELKKIKKWLLQRHRGEMRCGICGLPIESMDDCTIDHIIPKSKGGKTTKGNCQLAHRLCNFWKEDYVEPEKT